MSELDEALRGMLRRRSVDVTNAPAWLRAADFDRMRRESDDREAHDVENVFELSPSRRAHRVRRWPLLVAAAALVAAIGIATSVLVALPGHPVRTGQGPVRTVTRTTCASARGSVALASATKELSLHAPRGTLDRGILLASASSHGVLIAYPRRGASDGPHNGFDLVSAGSQVTDVHSFSSAPSRLLAWLPTPGGVPAVAAAISAQVDGRTVVLTVAGNDAAGRGLVGEVYSVDLVTGARTLVADSSTNGPGRRLTTTAVFRGIIYWQSDPVSGVGPGRIYARAVSGGPVRLVAAGRVILRGGPLGVAWNEGDRIDVPASVPAAVTQDGAPTFDTFADYRSDGRSWAWSSSDGSLKWFDPTSREVVRFPRLRVATRDSTLGILEVAGPLVYLQKIRRSRGRISAAGEILDARTGALMSYPAATTVVVGSRGVEWLLGLNGNGAHSVNTALGRLDTAQLAPVAC